ncbi:hypothetical protein OG349_16560 [Streptomyces sp. NBC_01317]|uniref:hypothetical protein n=1 Tax=Streptomyces sp. NBC_01317 TaxID=2903822 RepID=UPI002E0DEE45|nr:hypothetical protein OG349_16560 [Streptomyces sp. NBC_01317]
MSTPLPIRRSAGPLVRLTIGAATYATAARDGAAKSPARAAIVVITALAGLSFRYGTYET